MNKMLNLVKKEILSEMESVDEKWSQKYKKSINCNNPKGFSQRAHCQGRKKRNVSEAGPLDSESVKDTRQPSKFPITPKKFKEFINNQYPICSDPDGVTACLGKIQNDTCQTDEGIIYGPFSEKNLGLSDSDWSVVNRFDTNSQVHKGIWLIYKKDKQTKLAFKQWIIDNGKELFNGKYTAQLIDLNRATVEKGYKSESVAKNIIDNEFQPEKINQHCAGDIRDRKLGQDFDVIINGVSHYFQVKPISANFTIKKIISDVETYYEIPSYHKSSKYQEKYVDVIMYVNETNGDFVMFMNDEQKISTTASKEFQGPKFVIRYYENPLRTNMKIETINLGPSRQRKEFTQKKEELLKYYDEKIQQFQDLKSKLFQNESVKNGFKNWLNEMIS
jgi:hypothetical protein